MTALSTAVDDAFYYVASGRLLREIVAARLR